MRANLPIDVFAEYVHQGTILAVAHGDELKVCVVSQVLGEHGNVRVLYFSQVGEKIIKKQAVITHSELGKRCVIVPRTGMNDACTLYKEILDHSARLRAGNMRGLSGGTKPKPPAGVSFPPTAGVM